MDAGADVNAHDSEKIGNTALIVAVQEKNLEMVKLLLDYGADPNIRGWVNLSALDRARDWAFAPDPTLRTIFELLDRAQQRGFGTEQK